MGKPITREMFPTFEVEDDLMTNAKQSNGAADVLAATLISSNETAHDSDRQPANVVDSLFAIARAIEKLAFHVKYLGGGDNADTRGAVEFLAMKVESAGDRTSEAGDAPSRVPSRNSPRLSRVSRGRLAST
jgi:hypothetical protein